MIPLFPLADSLPPAVRPVPYTWPPFFWLRSPRDECISVALRTVLTSLSCAKLARVSIPVGTPPTFFFFSCSCFMGRASSCLERLEVDLLPDRS